MESKTNNIKFIQSLHIDLHCNKMNINDALFDKKFQIYTFKIKGKSIFMVAKAL